MFEGSRWFVTSDARQLSSGAGPGGSASWAVERVKELISAVGADPVLSDAASHDRAMAYVSHGPQLIASALVAVAAEHAVLGEAGPGFRDLTRIAGGPAQVWEDILRANRVEVARALTDIVKPLLEVTESLEEGGAAGLAKAMALLERARQARATETSCRGAEHPDSIEANGAMRSHREGGKVSP